MGLIFLNNANAQSAHEIKTENQENLVERVCVFDIDQTLIKEHGTGPTVTPHPQAKAAIKACLDKGYGVSIASASKGFRKNVLDAFKNDFGKYDLYNNFVIGDYTNVTKTSNNPYYIAKTSAAKTNKGDAMNRLMRTFFGYGVDKADVTNHKNPYTKAHPNPNKSDLSGCLVLFDDDVKNIDGINLFNSHHGTRFQMVQVKRGVGVTPEDVNIGMSLLDSTCRHDSVTLAASN